MATKKQLIILTLVATLIVLGYLFSTKDKTESPPPPPQITGLEIALKSISFIDKIRQPDGKLLTGFSCDLSLIEKCILSKEELTHSGQGILAYYFLAKATGDQSFKDKADGSLEYMLRKCESDQLFCEWNYFPIYKYYKDTGDDKYLQAMMRPVEKFMSASNKAVVDDNMGFKLAWLYDVTKDARYKNRLAEVADSELAKFPGEDKQFIYAIQIAWSILMPAYNTTNDPKYLQAVEQFFDRFNLLESLDKFQQGPSIGIAVDTLLNLSELGENKTEYRQQARAVLQELLFRFWDIPQNRKFNGDYGFINVIGDKTDKPLLFNGSLIQLYLRFGEEKFEEPRASQSPQ